MSRSVCLFCENYIPLYEGDIPKDPEISKLIRTSDSVQKSIDLSKKYFQAGLDDKELKEAEQLFKDPKVERLLKAAEKVGQRNGWISGGINGSMIGALYGGALSLVGSGPFFALVLLGALIGGLSVGFITSKIVGVLTRWKAEENISSGGGVRVHT